MIFGKLSKAVGRMQPTDDPCQPVRGCKLLLRASTIVELYEQHGKQYQDEPHRGSGVDDCRLLPEPPGHGHEQDGSVDHKPTGGEVHLIHVMAKKARTTKTNEPEYDGDIESHVVLLWGPHGEAQIAVVQADHDPIGEPAVEQAADGRLIAGPIARVLRGVAANLGERPARVAVKIDVPLQARQAMLQGSGARAGIGQEEQAIAAVTTSGA